MYKLLAPVNAVVPLRHINFPDARLRQFVTIAAMQLCG